MTNEPLKCCVCGADEYTRRLRGRIMERVCIYERQHGKIYCEDHLLDTAEKRAFERWFIDPIS